MDNIKNNYEIGQKLEIEIEKIVFGGEGLGRVDGFTVFVPMSVPGDILEIGTRQDRRYFKSEF